MTGTTIRSQILSALSHSEAEEGLYFDNLVAVHEEEERNVVVGSQLEILDELKNLIDEGLVEVREEGEALIFSLAK
jgi:hypothetical protein